jgi:hypothetical protein
LHLKFIIPHLIFRNPLDKPTRDDVKRVMSNRFAPRKNHPLIAVNKLIEKQEASIKVGGVKWGWCSV